MANNLYCVIMAGGIGSRFWPLSRGKRPKQFLDILGTGRTFIQQTYDRFKALVPDENFLVVTNAAYAPLVLEQLPMLKASQVLGEPIGRNTAPCIAWAAFRLRATDPGSTMIVTPADHLVLKEAEFHRAVAEGVEFAQQNSVLMTIGIQPSRPDTGYGYIQVGEKISGEVCKVKTFTEKPNLEMAKVFMESGEFFWNSGIFIWETSQIIEALEMHLPDTAALFDGARALYGTPSEAQAIEQIYSQCRPISIDFGVMEKASNVYVRCSEFGWSDIGTWGSLYQYSPKDEEGNAIRGEAMVYETKNCIVHVPEGKLAVVEGLDDYIVVQTEDALMICPKANEQNIKRFIDDVRFSKGEKFV